MQFGLGRGVRFTPNLFKFMKILVCLLLVSVILHAQTSSTDTKSTLAIPTVTTASTFLAGGVTLLPGTTPKPTGWFAVATEVNKTQKLYSISETDYSLVTSGGKLSLQTSARSGLATPLRAFGNVTVYGLVDAGIATTGVSTGGAYAGGGFALIPYKKFYIVVGARYLHAATSGSTALIELGVGKSTK